MFRQGYDTPLNALKPGLVKPVKGDSNCLLVQVLFLCDYGL